MNKHFLFIGSTTIYFFYETSLAEEGFIRYFMEDFTDNILSDYRIHRWTTNNIWQLFALLDEQTITIPFHTKLLYIHMTQIEKRSRDIQITNHNSTNSWRHTWNLGHVRSCSKFPHFFAHKTIHDCIADHVTYK